MTYTNYTKEQIASVVLEKIKQFRGNTKKDILLLTDEDCKELSLEELAIPLARNLMYRGKQLRKKFPSWIVSPISNILTGIKEANLSQSAPHGMPEFSEENYPLENLTEKKKIYVVHFNEIVMWGEKDKTNRLVERLRKHGKKPCVNAPNYLLGLLVKMNKKELMKSLPGVTYIVGAEPGNEKSLFRNENKSKVMIMAYLSRVNENDSIKLNFYPAGPICYEDYAFLAEDL